MGSISYNFKVRNLPKNVIRYPVWIMKNIFLSNDSAYYVFIWCLVNGHLSDKVLLCPLLHGWVSIFAELSIYPKRVLNINLFSWSQYLTKTFFQQLYVSGMFIEIPESSEIGQIIYFSSKNNKAIVHVHVYVKGTETHFRDVAGPGKFMIWARCYKTFYVCNLRKFVISWTVFY